MTNRVIYTTGGTVQANDGLYISRGADEELLKLCRAGSFAYILAPRQLGKSSLMARTAEQLSSGVGGEEVCSVMIDLSLLGKGVTADQWYSGILAQMEEKAGLSTDASRWWREHDQFGMSQRLSRFFRDVLLAEVKSPVVIFVDEIDSTLDRPFTDDFYALIRYIYNARADEEVFKRLSFVLIGVATPNDLISDPTRTPFNIGQQVDLTDFTFEEALPLADGLGLPPEKARQALRWVMAWTGGHPNLTQRLCRSIALEAKDDWTEKEVGRVVAQTFFGEKSAGDSNLGFVRDMLTKRIPETVEPAEVLVTYRDIRRGRPVKDEERSLIKSHLKLSGVVRRENGRLRVRNRIYKEVFDERWVKEHLPPSWASRQLSRVRRAAVALAAALIVVALLGAFAWRKADEANEQRRKADAQSAIAEQRRVEAVEQRQQAEEQRAEAVRQTQLAEEAKRQAEEALGVARRQTEIADAAREKERRQKLLTLAALTKANEEKKRADKNAEQAATNESRAQESEERIKREDVELRETNNELIKQKQLAEDNQRKAEDQAALARQNAVEAKANAEKAEANEKKAEAAINTVEEVDSSLIEHFKGTMRGHAWPVNTASFNSTEDKKALRVVTASDDKTARVWDVNSPREEYLLLKGHEAPVTGAVFDPAGHLVLTASRDKTARLWDVGARPAADGDGGDAKVVKPRNEMRHDAPVTSAEFSRDAELVVTASENGKAWVWRTSDGALLKEPMNHAGRGSPTAANGGGSPANGSGSSAKGDGQATPATSLAARASLNRDQTLVVTSGVDNVAKVWDWKQPSEPVLELKGHNKLVNTAAFSPDGRYVVTTSLDGRAMVWDVSAKRRIVTYRNHHCAINSAEFSRDGKYVVTASDDGTAHVWEAKSGKTVAELRGHRGLLISRTFSGSAMRALLNPFSLRAFPLDFDLKHREDKYVRLYSAKFNADATRVVTADGQGTVRIWDVKGKKLLTVLHGFAGAAVNAEFSGNGDFVVAASVDRTARVWDTKEDAKPTRKQECPDSEGKTSQMQ